MSSTSREMLSGLKRAEKEAERIEAEGRKKAANIARDGELHAHDVKVRLASRTDTEITRLEKDADGTIAAMREENETIGRARADAMRKASTARMPGLVGELRGKFKDEVLDR